MNFAELFAGHFWLFLLERPWIVSTGYYPLDRFGHLTTGLDIRRAHYHFAWYTACFRCRSVPCWHGSSCCSHHADRLSYSLCHILSLRYSHASALTTEIYAPAKSSSASELVASTQRWALSQTLSSTPWRMTGCSCTLPNSFTIDWDFITFE